MLIEIAYKNLSVLKHRQKLKLRKQDKKVSKTYCRPMLSMHSLHLFLFVCPQMVREILSVRTRSYDGQLKVPLLRTALKMEEYL